MTRTLTSAEFGCADKFIGKTAIEAWAALGSPTLNAARVYLYHRGLRISDGVYVKQTAAADEQAIASRRVYRDPCFRCGARGDLGFEHSPAPSLAFAGGVGSDHGSVDR